MTMYRSELDKIKNRHKKAEEDYQPGWREEYAGEAHEDRAALLAALEASEAKHDSDHNLISSLQWQVECDRKIGGEWKQRAEAAEAREQSIRALLSKVAAIAHCGGLADLDTFSALIEIRKLTLSAWDNSGSVQEQRNRVLLTLAETAP